MKKAYIVVIAGLLVIGGGVFSCFPLGGPQQANARVRPTPGTSTLWDGDGLSPTWFAHDYDGDQILLKEKDDGRRVEVKEDQTLVISLKANPSTGYLWEVQEIDGERIRQLPETEFRSEPGLLGAPGEQILRFKVLRDDDVHLSLVYHRPWEDKEPSKTFSVQVEGVGTFTGSADQLAEPKATATPLPSYGESNATSHVQSTQSLPSSFNWCAQGGCTPIKNQGGCGSCWAFATAGVVESAIKISDGVSRDLSEQYLLSCNTDGYGCGGGWWAFNYYLYKVPPGEPEAGAVYESEFPYVAYQAPCNPPHTHHEKLNTWGQIGSSVSVIKQAIYDYGPVAVSVCSGSAFSSYPGGLFNTDESAYCGGGTNHAVVLVGWDDSLGSAGAWRLRNSWGGWWGESGYMWIEYGTSNVGANVAYVDYGNGGSTNNAPYTPSNPSPYYGATDQSVGVDLTWSGGDPDSGDSVTYDVYMEATDSTPDYRVCNNAPTPFCDPGPLSLETYYWWYVIATDNHGDSSTSSTWYFRTESAPSVGPLVYQSHAVDDDNSSPSVGDGNGTVNPGETIELSVDLHNQGPETAHGVAAVLSTSDAYVSLVHNQQSYPDIPGGETRACYNDFVFEVDPSAPAGHVIQFELDMTASNGGPWSDTFDVTVQGASDAVVSIVPASSSVYEGDTFDVTVDVAGVQDLGSYEFTIDFNPDLLQVLDVADGGFLGSTGRSVTPLGPSFQSGSVTFGAVSSGTPGGPDGSGSLAVVTLEAVGVGTTSLDLHNVTLQDTSSVTQDSVVEDGTVEVVSNPCVAPSIDSMTSDSPVSLGETMHFAATTSGSSPITYYWDFNNDGYKEQTGEGLDQVAHTYAATGSYIARLSVENACGSDWESIMVEVEPGSCVPVSIDGLVSNSPVALGESMYFTATVSGSGPVSYGWDFGSTGAGTDLDTATPAFTYDTDGTHTVNVTVDNACGTDQSALNGACVLLGDFDHSGTVALADIMMVVDRWRMTDSDPDWEPCYDLDGNGVITIVDVMMAVNQWGDTCS